MSGLCVRNPSWHPHTAPPQPHRTAPLPQAARGHTAPRPPSGWTSRGRGPVPVQEPTGQNGSRAHRWLPPPLLSSPTPPPPPSLCWTDACSQRRPKAQAAEQLMGPQGQLAGQMSGTRRGSLQAGIPPPSSPQGGSEPVTLHLNLHCGSNHSLTAGRHPTVWPVSERARPHTQVSPRGTPPLPPQPPERADSHEDWRAAL